LMSALPLKRTSVHRDVSFEPKADIRGAPALTYFAGA
jgi:hypothetical protein